jgi:hypothetical protein
MDAWGVILLYLLMLAFTIAIFRKNYTSFLAGLAVLVIFAGTRASLQYASHSQQKLIVYSLLGNTAIDLVSGEKNLFISGKGLCQRPWLVKMKIDPYRISRKLDKTASCFIDSISLGECLNPPFFNKRINPGCMYFKLGNKRIVVLSTRIKNRGTEKETPFETDYLILSGKAGMDTTKILSRFKAGTIIGDTSVPAWLDKKLSQLAQREGYSYYSVREKGAFISDL